MTMLQLPYLEIVIPIGRLTRAVLGDDLRDRGLKVCQSINLLVGSGLE